MSKKYLLIGLVFVFLISINYASSTTESIIPSYTLSSSATQNADAYQGIAITTGQNNISSITVCKHSSDNGYNVTLKDSSCNYLAENTSFTNNCVIIYKNLNKASQYFLDVRLSSPFTRRYTSTVSYPYTGSLFNISSGSNYCTVDTGFAGSIINVTVTDISNSISLSSLSPINLTYTSTNTPTFTFNITSIVGTWNTTLWLNNSNSYGSNNSISTTGSFIITSTTLPSGEYLWWINATSGSLSQITEKRNIFISPSTGGTSCVQTLTNAYFIPDGCTSST